MDALTQRDYMGNLISKALDLGIDARIRGGAIVLGANDWNIALESTQADLFLMGYANGVADTLKEKENAVEGRED